VIAIVHDEFVIEVPEALADYTARLMAEAMQAAAETFLHTVTLAPAAVTISDHWSK
jgi:DNA polymerase I-like protein with 3'-5' exonuclease and polymerase domains